MNFLHITSFYPPFNFGGDGLFVQELSRRLVADGHHVEVAHCIDAFHASGGADPAAPMGRNADGVIVHALKSPLGLLSPLLTHQTGNSWLKRSALRQILESRRFDVVHMHNMSLIGIGAIDCVPAVNRPVTLYTAHEHWLVCPMHTLWSYTNEPCKSPKCIRCSLANCRPPQLWRLTNRMQRFAEAVDEFISPSRFAAALHLERGFPRPMTVLPNFAPPSALDFERLPGSPNPRPYFLYVGRLERIKGVHTLISAWRDCTGADLVIAGSGSYEPELRRLAQGNDRVRFLGRVRHESLDNWYANAVATIIPSLCHEVFPLVVIESLARRTPVIASGMGALGDVVRTSGGGLTYERDTELVECVRKLLGSAESRDALSLAGHAAYLRNWTPRAHLDRYYGVIDAVRSRRPEGQVMRLPQVAPGEAT